MIPGTAHFIWFGAEFEWVHALAVRSAARVGGFERVVLHHDRDLSHTAAWADLGRIPSFEARRLDGPALTRLFGRLGPSGDALARVFAQLDAPAARANVLRALILAVEGGVYLDLDTITVRSLEPLRAAHAAFCGEETLAWPISLGRNGGIAGHVGALVRDGVRDVYRRLPGGWRGFRRVAPLYPTAANNAVLGAEPGHPMLGRLLAGMLAVPESRRRVRCALGTHLLQATLADRREGDLAVLPPRVFYPLGPELSAHWFRIRRRLPALDQVLSPDTRVVHWYASVRTKHIVPHIDADYVRAHATRQLFSALALAELQA